MQLKNLESYIISKNNFPFLFSEFFYLHIVFLYIKRTNIQFWFFTSLKND